MNQHTGGWGMREIALVMKHATKNRTAYQVYQECKKDGLNRTFYAVENRLTEFKRGLFNIEDKPYRIGYLDIETTSLDQFAEMLTWCIKERDGSIEHDMVCRDELINYKGDRRIMKTLCAAMHKYTHLYTYYGGDYHFDVPMIRTKAVQLGIEFPSHGRLFQTDIWTLAKRKLRFRRYSLAALCQYFGIRGKTPLEPEVWMRAKYGDKKSLDKILKHNKGDVMILEKLHKKLETFAPSSKASI